MQRPVSEFQDAAKFLLREFPLEEPAQETEQVRRSQLDFLRGFTGGRNLLSRSGGFISKPGCGIIYSNRNLLVQRSILNQGIHLKDIGNARKHGCVTMFRLEVLRVRHTIISSNGKNAVGRQQWDVIAASRFPESDAQKSQLRKAVNDLEDCFLSRKESRYVVGSNLLRNLHNKHY